MPTISELLKQQVIPLQDAKYILMHVLNINQLELLTSANKSLSESQLSIYNTLVAKRIGNTPLEYIINTSFFMGLTFFVNNHVLIPRNETEQLVEEVIAYIKHNNIEYMIDMCTGSGCILISLLHSTNITGLGVDISPNAINIAKKNAKLNNVSCRAHFINSDLFQNLDRSKKVNLIVSNPPYIPSYCISTLDDSVKNHEPHLALDGGIDGTLFYERLANEAFDFLKLGGAIFMEIGFNQGEAVSKIFLSYGYKNIIIKKDYSKNDRILIAFKS